ncbi:hypothetical protein LIER_20735 [Lithospermum erythrorhizon]|uniref:RNase H type-1 domain-containing protein n=1 Tax=Lithospermum erythrorhizon TaxID=34254 RepID=A0AAV3QML8_LITER
MIVQRGMDLANDFTKAWRRRANLVLTGVANGAGCKQVEFVSSALVTEALARREGMHFAWEKSYARVELETDSKVLVDIINGARRCPTEVEVVIADILHLAGFLEVKFQYVKRTSNIVSHTVAHWNYQGVLEAEWLTTFPSWLYQALLKYLCC